MGYGKNKGRTIRNRHLVYFAGILLGVMMLFAWAVSFNGLYGQDAHAYVQYAQKLYEAILLGTNPGSFFWPVVYPLLGALGAFVMPPVFGMQFISMASLALSMVYLNKLLRWFHPAQNARVLVFSIVAFVLSPYVLRASLVSMADMPTLFFVLASLYHVFRYTRSPRFWDVALGSLFAVLGCFTRYAAVVLMIIPGILLLSATVRERNWLHLGAMVLFAVMAATPQWAIKGVEAPIWDHPFFYDWSLLNFFKSDFDYLGSRIHYPVVNVIHVLFNVFHPAFLFFGLPLLFFFQRQDLKRKETKILLAMYVLYALLLCGIPYQNKRYLILNFPLVICLLFPAFERAMTWLRQRLRLQPLLVLSVIILVQVVLFARVFYPFWKLNIQERQIATYLQQKEEKRLYTFSMDIALKTYEVPQSLINLQTDTLGKPDTGSWVLFNSMKFESQWKGARVMENWQELNDCYTLRPDTTFQSGWTLYRLGE